MTDRGTTIRDIVASYDDLVTRLYSRVRFTILRQVFLEEIGQYLPANGRILDLGCGFGLFSLYFAALGPERRITGVDRNTRRIAMARQSAERLGLSNVTYAVADAVAWDCEERFDAIYMLDLIHHLPRSSVAGFLAAQRSRLTDDGLLILKEVEDRPWHKVLFTLALDRLMVGKEPIHYWSAADLSDVLGDLGFDTVRHRMRDILPYPHILYVSRLRPAAPA